MATSEAIPGGAATADRPFARWVARNLLVAALAFVGLVAWLVLRRADADSPWSESENDFLCAWVPSADLAGPAGWMKSRASNRIGGPTVRADVWRMGPAGGAGAANWYLTLWRRGTLVSERRVKSLNVVEGTPVSGSGGVSWTPLLLQPGAVLSQFPGDPRDAAADADFAGAWRLAFGPPPAITQPPAGNSPRGAKGPPAPPESIVLPPRNDSDRVRWYVRDGAIAIRLVQTGATGDARTILAVVGALDAARTAFDGYDHLGRTVRGTKEAAR
ncbi:MAG: hypothetical protein HMLKMBBP_03156 [Planctomycetes bacterium]|nr:hypothetical protein [Planctomycetota bacterium]